MSRAGRGGLSHDHRRGGADVPFAWYLHRWAGRASGCAGASSAGCGLHFNLGLLSSALLRTSAANATLLDNTAPIWVGLGALIFFHEKLGRRYWAGWCWHWRAQLSSPVSVCRRVSSLNAAT